MKMITAKVYGSTKNDYGFDGMKFGFCTAPVARRVEQIIQWETCRESVTKYLRDRILGSSNRIDLRKTRMLIYMRAAAWSSSLKAETVERHIAKHHKKAHKDAQAGLKLINHYEKKLKWPLTRMYRVDIGHTPQAYIYMLVGSSRWQKSTHCLSLYLLMIRLGRHKFHSKFKNNKELLDELKAYSKRRLTDAGHVRQTYEKWLLFLENQDRLFAGRNRVGIYSRASLHGQANGFHEGIQQLCVGYSSDLTLTEKFARICDENNIKQEQRVKERIIKQDASNRRSHR